MQERSLTLLEIVVASTLILGSILSTVTVIDSSSRAAVAASAKRTATEVAESQLARLEVVPYPELGLDPTLGQFPSVVDGDATVSVPDSGVEARSTLQREGRTFEVTRLITWSEGDQEGPGVFKIIRVGVTWSTPLSGAVELTGASGPSGTPVACTRDWVDGTGVTLSGTINTYYPITTPTAAGATELEVGSATGPPLRVGDTVLVMQMTGEDAGFFEYAVAGSSADSGRVVLSGASADAGLLHAYGVTGAAQVVRVPTVGDAFLDADVGAPPWDGSIGGIVALDATGNVTGPGALRAEGAGLTTEATAGDVPQRLRMGGGPVVHGHGDDHEGDSSSRGGGIVAVRGVGPGSLGVNLSADPAPGSAGAAGSVLVVGTQPLGTVSAVGGIRVGGPGGGGPGRDVRSG